MSPESQFESQHTSQSEEFRLNLCSLSCCTRALWKIMRIINGSSAGFPPKGLGESNYVPFSLADVDDK